ncbi:hypothetical protein MPER_02119, partial [Moniliophthora perniciosa FA553]
VYDTPSVKPCIVGVRAGKQEPETYIKAQLATVWHQSGTAAMLPREDGGVVDERLRVYGTKGLRVIRIKVTNPGCAASLGHTQSVVHAHMKKDLFYLSTFRTRAYIAFQAAEILLEEY